MATRADVVAEAARWVGTPYHHQARVRGVGVDCAQLVAGVAEAVGLIPAGTPVPHDYSPEWHLHSRGELLVANLEAFGCVRLARPEDARPGDVLAFRFGRSVGHLGILLEGGLFVHARVDNGRVVVNSLSTDSASRAGFWADRHEATYALPGLTENIT
jgi:NlpC/P60 family putative phage cell wall peptidase